MPLPLLGLGLITQGLSSGYGIIKGIQAQQQARKINPERFAYGDPRLQGAESPYAKQMLGQAQMALNARSPYAAAQQRGILGSQAGAMASAQRSVTDPTQLLAVTAALQGGANRSLFEQGAQEQEAYQRSLSNLMGAQQVMIGEGDKVYQDRMNKFLMDQQRKDALQQAGTQSIVSGFGNMAGTLIGASTLKGLPTQTQPVSQSISKQMPSIQNMAKSALPSYQITPQMPSMSNYKSSLQNALFSPGMTLRTRP